MIYLIRQETNSERLVIEIYLRNGRIIDPSDDTEGLRNRPPTEEDLNLDDSETGLPDQGVSTPLEKVREALEAELASGDQVEVVPVDREASHRRDSAMLTTTAAGLVATRSFGTWARKVDRALAQADKKKWRELRRRSRDKRKNRE